MVKVERLEVVVARGLSHLDKGDDVGVINVEKGGVGAAAGGTLAVGKARGVVDASGAASRRRSFRRRCGCRT